MQWHTHKLTGWSYVFPAAGGWTVINYSSFLSCCFRRTLPCLDCKFTFFNFNWVHTHFFLSVYTPSLFFIMQATNAAQRSYVLHIAWHGFKKSDECWLWLGLVWFKHNQRTIKLQLHLLDRRRQVSSTFWLIRWSVLSVPCDFHCTVCL